MIFLITSLLLACIRPYITVPESDRSVEDAINYYKEGDYQGALSLVRDYLNRYPSAYNRDDALKIAAVCSYELKDYGLAIRYTREIIRRFPYSEHISHAHLIYGLAKINLGRNEEGVASLIKVIQKSSNEKERQEAMTKVDSLLPLLPVTSLQKIHHQNVGLPIDEWVLFHLGKKEIEENRYDQACKDLSRYLELFPTGLHADSVRSLLRVAGMGGSTGRIGLLIPLTGQFSDYGADAQDGFLSEFPDTEKIFIADTKSDPIEALIKARKMVDAKVDIIVGPIFAVEALPVAGLIFDAGIPLILPTESDPRFSRLPEGVISLSNETIQDTKEIARFAIEKLNLKRFAILYPQTDPGRFLAQIFKKEIMARAGEIVIEASFHPDSLTLKWELLAIKRKKPEAIFLPVDPEQLVMACTQIKYYELLNTKVLTIGTTVTDDVLRLGEEYVNGVYFARPEEVIERGNFVRDRFARAAKIVWEVLRQVKNRSELIGAIRGFAQFEDKIFVVKNGEIKPVEE